MTKRDDIKNQIIVYTSLVVGDGVIWSEQHLIIKITDKFSITKEDFFLHFPNGLKELIDEYFVMIDNKVALSLSANQDFLASGTTKKVRTALLEYISTQGIKSLPNQAKFFLNPCNLDLALKLKARISDNIWKLAGDNSVDFNFYTKRIILSAVYESVLIYSSVQANNISIKDIEDFVDKRLENVMMINKGKALLNKILPKFC